MKRNTILLKGERKMENKEMIMDEVVNATEEVVSKGLNKGLLLVELLS